MPYKLKYPSGDDYELVGDAVWIGNDPTDEIQLYDFQTQPHMAVIELSEQGYFVTNRGTFVFYVNGNEVQPGDWYSLENGYEIRIGQSVITYFWVDEPVYEYEPESSSSRGWMIIAALIVVAVVVIFFYSGLHFK